MEFMGFHIVDIIVVTLVAFLAIKGLVNGFFKELLNFISIVGGVMLAARYHLNIVQFINEQNLLPQIPDAFAKIIGFVLILMLTWLIIGFIATILNNFVSKENGFISRFAGYLLSVARYIFVFSLIIFGVSQSEFFKESAEKFNTETKLFEPMSKLGTNILNIDLIKAISQDTNKTKKKEVNLSEINLSIKASSTKVVEHNASN